MKNDHMTQHKARKSIYKQRKKKHSMKKHLFVYKWNISEVIMNATVGLVCNRNKILCNKLNLSNYLFSWIDKQIINTWEIKFKTFEYVVCIMRKATKTLIQSGKHIEII